MIASGKVQPETGAYIIEYKHYSVIVTEFSDRLPFFTGRADIVIEITVIIWLCYQRCDIALVIVNRLLQRLHIKPRNDYVVSNILRKDARIVSLHCPRVITVIISLEKYSFFAFGMCSGAHYRKGRGVCAVLHKICPVRGRYCVNKQFCTLDHFI